MEYNIQNERSLYKGFKLISLELTNFSVFGSIKYDFIDKEDKQDKIYTTVIIGPNGTRKSLLFNLIVYIFKCISDLQENKEIFYSGIKGGVAHKTFKDGKFHLIYSFNNNLYEIIRLHGVDENKINHYLYSLLKNGQKCEIADLNLPKTIVGNSINITDKFPFYKEKEFPLFHYLGIRNSPQSASTKSYIKKTIDYVTQLSFPENFLKGLNLINETFIGENRAICISFKTVNYKRFFDGNLTERLLDEFFQEMEDRFIEKQKAPPYKLGTFHSLKSKNKAGLQSAIDYCNYLVRNDELKKIEGASSRLLKFDLSKEEDLKRLNGNGLAINILYSLNLLFDPKIELIGINGDEYSLDESSSGEHNLITSLIGLMATYKEDSLLLIDEPEISLHPNWQMKYVSFLKRLLQDEMYSNSHILIATHSHFIVSDLEGESSKIIGLRKNNGIEIVEMAKGLNTFGWSAEDVLYNIFNVRSSLNYYLQADLTELLGMISNNIKDTNKIETIVTKLNALPKRENDPLQEIISEATVYLNSIR